MVDRFDVFIHLNPDNYEVTVRGKLAKLQNNKWELSWDFSHKWPLTDEQVLLLTAGGTIKIGTDWLVISMVPNTGGILTEQVAETVWGTPA
jgi:hypothetical protein